MGGARLGDLRCELSTCHSNVRYQRWPRSAAYVRDTITAFEAVWPSIATPVLLQNGTLIGATAGQNSFRMLDGFGTKRRNLPGSLHPPSCGLMVGNAGQTSRPRSEVADLRKATHTDDVTISRAELATCLDRRWSLGPGIPWR